MNQRAGIRGASADRPLQRLPAGRGLSGRSEDHMWADRQSVLSVSQVLLFGQEARLENRSF